MGMSVKLRIAAVYRMNPGLPQIFQYPLIYGAYTSIRQKEMTGITDDAIVRNMRPG